MFCCALARINRGLRNIPTVEYDMQKSMLCSTVLSYNKGCDKIKKDYQE